MLFIESLNVAVRWADRKSVEIVATEPHQMTGVEIRVKVTGFLLFNTKKNIVWRGTRVSTSPFIIPDIWNSEARI